MHTTKPHFRHVKCELNNVVSQTSHNSRTPEIIRFHAIDLSAKNKKIKKLKSNKAEYQMTFYHPTNSLSSSVLLDATNCKIGRRYSLKWILIVLDQLVLAMNLCWATKCSYLFQLDLWMDQEIQKMSIDQFLYNCEFITSN